MVRIFAKSPIDIFFFILYSPNFNSFSRLLILTQILKAILLFIKPLLFNKAVISFKVIPGWILIIFSELFEL